MTHSMKIAITGPNPTDGSTPGTLSFDDATGTVAFTPDDTTQSPIVFSGLTAQAPFALADLGAAIDAGTLYFAFGTNPVGGGMILLKRPAIGSETGDQDLAHLDMPADSGQGSNNPPGDGFNLVLESFNADPSKGWCGGVQVSAQTSAPDANGRQYTTRRVDVINSARGREQRFETRFAVV